jgi:hypothetical protein
MPNRSSLRSRTAVRAALILTGIAVLYLLLVLAAW